MFVGAFLGTRLDFSASLRFSASCSGHFGWKGELVSTVASGISPEVSAVNAPLTMLHWPTFTVPLVTPPLSASQFTGDSIRSVRNARPMGTSSDFQREETSWMSALVKIKPKLPLKFFCRLAPVTPAPFSWRFAPRSPLAWP